MIDFDKHNYCYKHFKALNEAEQCLFENIIEKHASNYNPSKLTREVDEHFGVTKLTDCAHRIVKQINGVNGSD